MSDKLKLPILFVKAVGVLALSPGKLLKIRYDAFRKAFRGCCIGFFCWIVWKILKFFFRIFRLGGMYMKNELFRYIFSLDCDSRMFRFMHRVLELWFSLFKVECKICYNKKSNLCVNLLCGHCVCFDCKKHIFLCPFCKQNYRLWSFLATAILRKYEQVFYR